jgi:hypothetical protein
VKIYRVYTNENDNRDWNIGFFLEKEKATEIVNKAAHSFYVELINNNDPMLNDPPSFIRYSDDQITVHTTRFLVDIIELDVIIENSYIKDSQ